MTNVSVDKKNYFTNALRDDGHDTAFGIFRGHPVHIGHVSVVNEMTQRHKTVIIGIGSAQRSDESGYPFTFEQRKQMWANVFGDRCRYVPIVDLGASTPFAWSEYVLNKITKVGLPEPTVYYGGIENASWFKEHFVLPGSEANENHVTVNGVTRRVELISRNIPISGTELRSMIELNLPMWKKFVPEINHKLVKEYYPKHLIVG